MGQNQVEEYWKTRGKLGFSGVNTNDLTLSEATDCNRFLSGELLHQSLPELHHGHRFSLCKRKRTKDETIFKYFCLFITVEHSIM